jgi:NAD(P)-dependent dehydrogenase (short-subunit alcohol dehydrogenase family)
LSEHYQLAYYLAAALAMNRIRSNIQPFFADAQGAKPLVDFNNRLAIITGGANGIGRELAKALSRAGARVVVADVNDELGERVVDDISATGGVARYRHTDVADEQSMADLFADTRANEGAIDFAFNNAGIAVGGDSRDLTFDQWRKVTDVNYWGVVYGSKFAFDAMAEQGHGHIVNIASLAGLIPFPTSLPYAATKHAVVGLSMSLRAEGRDLGVKVSVVCPGFIDSNIYSAAEVVNLPPIDVAADIPFKLVETDKAAAKILKGVARNKAIIVFPTYARIFWWISRLKYALLSPLSMKTVRDMRKLRRKE